MTAFQVSLFCTATAVMMSSAFASEGWMTNLPAAMQRAEQENKLVLVEFTGSDWCTACVALKRNVLDKPEFREWAGEHFIFVEIDLPQSPDFPAEQRAQNEATAEHYQVGGFPTILILNPQGNVIGGFSGSVRGIKEAVVPLEHALKANELYHQAERLSGPERARALYQIYSNFPEGKGFDTPRRALRDTIIQADPENVTGIHHDAAVQEQAQRFFREREALPILSPALGELLERQLAEALPENRPAVMLERCQYAMCTAETVDDITAVKQMFEEVIPLLPASEAADIRHYVDTYFSNPAALLQMLKASRPR